MGLGIGQRLIAAGKATVGVMAKLIPPMVGREDIADAIGYVEGAVAPSSVVPDFIGQKYFDTVTKVFYIAFGTAAGEWTPLGDDTLSLAELAVLDGATAANATAGKAAILGTGGVLQADGIQMSALRYVSVALTAALLDGALEIVVQAGVTGDQYKVRDIILEGGGTNFGAGGDRTLTLTDGTTVWTTIPNASLETLAAAGARWGSTAVPATTTSNTSSAAGAAIVFKYAGGTTDHTTGATRATVCLEKVT